MPENHETSPIAEGQTGQIKVPVSGSEQHEAPNPLSLKLNQIQTDSRIRTERLSFALKGSTETTVEARTEPLPPEALYSNAEDILQTDSSPLEYLIKSERHIKDTGQTRKKIIEEHQDAQRKEFNHSTELRRVGAWLKAINSEGRLKRFMRHFEKGRLIQEQAQHKKGADEQQILIDLKKRSLYQVNETEKVVNKKRETVIIGEGSAGVGAIRAEYEEFLNAVLEDGTITSEIQDAYIRDCISPQLDEAEVSNEKKEEFYSALKNYLQHREAPESERRALREEVEKFNNEHGFYDARKEYEALLDSEDKNIITSLVAKIAATDIDELRKVVVPNLSYHPSFEESLIKAINPDGNSWLRKDNFQTYLLSETDRKQKPWLSDTEGYPKMSIWEAVKRSPAANELFGNIIKAEDDRIYTTALGKSLSDDRGTDIDILEHYPRPEAIRNLVLLAAADYQQYRTVHANGVLSKLAARDNWNEILDQVEQIYPTLKSARPFLEHWNFREQYSNPDIQEAAKDFALSLTENEDASGKIKGLAAEALHNESLLEVLRKRGTISENEASGLKEGEACIQRINQQRDQNWRENRDSGDIPYIGNLSLKGVIRQNLFKLMDFDQANDQEQLNSMRRLTALSQRILDNKSNYSTLSYLASDEVVDVIANKQIQPELIFLFPELARPFMDAKMKELRSFVFNHADSMLKDSTDLKFLNTVAGEFGLKSDIILKGYQECLEAGVVTTAEKDLVLEFGRQFRVISPTTLNGYKEAKEAGHEKVYTAQLTALAEKMTGSAVVTDEERAKPYYKDLLRHVYSNNAGQWTTFESNNSCSDRSNDLTEFKVKPRYELDLLSQSEIRVRAGEALNPQVQEEVQAPIFAVSTKMNETGFDYERIKTDLGEELDKKLNQVAENGGLEGVSLDSVNTQEEKLFLILADSIYGAKVTDTKSIKNLVIAYEFANFEDISDYIAGTRDRVGRANNQDYALLCEVGAFYSDRIKEVNRRLVESGWNNPAIAQLMPEYFRKLAQEAAATGRQNKINRLQVDKLGLSDNFVRQVGRVLEKRKGRKYEPEEIRELVSRYENLTDSLTEKSSSSKKPQTRAFYGQLRSQREKTIEAMRVITGEEVDPKKVHLGEVNLQQVLDTEANIREGRYDDDQFASYTVQRFIDLFEDERTKINGELSKFESLSGKQREVLHGYITKTKETAHARMVGGVCVSGDNPDKYKDKNMWDMPNYFQLVLQEPDTLQCQGLVLLHHFTQGDKKILTASLNPSSTYLYSIDEAALFKGIMGTLEEFAQENNFNKIILSKNKTIRTNRTGGQFEKSMDERIAKVDKEFKFDEVSQFSYHPDYKLKEMDVVWESGN